MPDEQPEEKINRAEMLRKAKVRVAAAHSNTLP